MNGWKTFVDDPHEIGILHDTILKTKWDFLSIVGEEWADNGRLLLVPSTILVEILQGHGHNPEHGGVQNGANKHGKNGEHHFVVCDGVNITVTDRGESGHGPVQRIHILFLLVQTNIYISRQIHKWRPRSAGAKRCKDKTKRDQDEG